MQSRCKAGIVPFSLIVPEYMLNSLSEGEKIKLCRKYKVDYLIEEVIGYKQFYCYVDEDYMPNIGDKINREDNHFSFMGEGLYCYYYEGVEDIDYNPNKHVIIMEGDINHYVCRFDMGDENKDKYEEVLIPSDKYVTVVEKLQNTVILVNKIRQDIESGISLFNLSEKYKEFSYNLLLDLYYNKY